MRTAIAMVASALISLAILGLVWLVFAMVGLSMPGGAWIIAALLVSLAMATVTSVVLR